MDKDDKNSTVCGLNVMYCRCQASTVAVTVAIALMLQRPPAIMLTDGMYNVEDIAEEAYKQAENYIDKENEKVI